MDLDLTGLALKVTGKVDSGQATETVALGQVMGMVDSGQAMETADRDPELERADLVLGLGQEILAKAMVLVALRRSHKPPVHILCPRRCRDKYRSLPVRYYTICHNWGLRQILHRSSSRQMAKEVS